MITQAALKEVLHYDSDTGVFVWKRATSYRVRIGDTAGCISKQLGYVLIRVYGTLYYAHRLAWLYTHGVFPKFQVDHRNRVGIDNRLNNLRQATHQQNLCNRSLSKNNSSGVSGVGLNGKYIRARIVVNGMPISLGNFSTIEAATTVRVQAEAKYFGEFAP